MFESLKNIHNPVLRSLTAAAAAFSIVTVVSGLAIATIAPKNKAAYQSGIYAALIALGGGATLGLVTAGTGRRQTATTSVSSNIEADGIWHDWRNFVVDRKVEESEEITSFYQIGRAHV